jgi:hypothetical protein
MNEHGKSDRPIVPKKFPNKTRTPAAEEMEGRGLAKGNLGQRGSWTLLRHEAAGCQVATMRRADAATESVDLAPGRRCSRARKPAAKAPFRLN